MLESIKISKQATYQREDQYLQNLKKINYIFGCNGSVKTKCQSANRIDDNECKYPCPSEKRPIIENVLRQLGKI